MTNRTGRRWWLGGIAAILTLSAVLAFFAPYVVAVQWWFSEGKPTIASVKPRLASGTSWFDDWFVVQSLDANTIAIGEPRYGQCNFAYLFIGRDRALLFDSGPGLRNIRAVTNALTHLPVTVLPSHLHFDHTGGLRQFSTVALPDIAGLRARAPYNNLQLNRFEHLGLMEGVASPKISVALWIKPQTRIDLGSRTVTLFATPGHTDNSIALRDDRTGDLYTGDTLYPGNVYAFLPGTDFERFGRSAKRLLELADNNTRIHGGHGCADPAVAVAAPEQRKPALAALVRDLGLAIHTTLDPSMPRAIDTGDGIVLRAKHPWMAR